MPHNYSEEDRIAIFSLGWLVRQGNLEYWEVFKPEEFEKYIKNGKSILVGNTFSGNIPIKTVYFQNKKFTLYSQISKVKDFGVNERKNLFEVKSLNLEIQSTE